jgi:hypothetical protein
MIGALCAVVREVTVPNYQRQRVVESIDCISKSSAFAFNRLCDASIGQYVADFCFVFFCSLLTTFSTFKLSPGRKGAC